eukprot:215107-Prymnesium_polylepis.2
MIVIDLDDPSHLNALSSALVRNLSQAVEYLIRHVPAHAFVLQAVGPHFCVGGNPYENYAHARLPALAGDLLLAARSCCRLRELAGPSIAAVHGHVVGGGVALALNTSCLYAAWM